MNQLTGALKTRRFILSLALPSLLLPACLENEEEIEVRPDGSVRVTLSAAGDLADLADGYPVPLGPGWELASEDARRWLREVGVHTGGADAPRRAREIRDERTWNGSEDPEGRLTVERTFASVAEMPRWLAPESEPYRSAHLERTTELEVREQDGRRVFVFERVFHGFDRAALDLHERIELPPELRQKLEAEQPLSALELATIAERAGTAYEELAVEFAEDALLGIFTGGDASLAPERVPAVLERLRDAARMTVTLRRMTLLLEAFEQQSGGALAAEQQDAARLFEELESDWRAALRTALAAALDEAGVGVPTRNAALYALEWQFTAFDHFGDLGDEKFVVRVKLPGTLVGGNYAETDDGAAVWEFEGGELHGKDVILRAVAVLDTRDR